MDYMYPVKGTSYHGNLPHDHTKTDTLKHKK